MHACMRARVHACMHAWLLGGNGGEEEEVALPLVTDNPFMTPTSPPDVGACMHACVRACMHACVRACMHVCMHGCAVVMVVATNQTKQAKPNNKQTTNQPKPTTNKTTNKQKHRKTRLCVHFPPGSAFWSR